MAVKFEPGLNAKYMFQEMKMEKEDPGEGTPLRNAVNL